MSVVVFPAEVSLALALCFDASLLCSAKGSNFIMKKRKSHISAALCILLVSHANLKLHRSLIIEIESKGSKLCGFICVIMHFVVLLIFWKRFYPT